MEDYVQAQFSRHPVTGEPIGFFGVYDGHGGHWAASFVNNNLLNNLLAHEEFDTDLRTALSKSYHPTRSTGSTVSVDFRVMSSYLIQ